jgi:hypothetical protein
LRGYYNDVRPHRDLGRRTPAEAYRARPRAAASGIPLIDGHFRVRPDKIDSNGKLTLRHNSRLHHIGIGRRYAGTPVLVLVHDLHVRVLTTSGKLLRDLTLEPATTNQRPQRERCPETPVNGVAGYRSCVRGATRYIRTRLHMAPSSCYRMD